MKLNIARYARQQGFMLVEMIIFIIILGLASVGLMISFQVFLSRSPTVNRQTTAIGLAQERMELILAQKRINGFTSLTDPCNNSPAPSICTALTNYTIASPAIVAAAFSGDSNYKIITVSVSGFGNAVLTALVAS